MEAVSNFALENALDGHELVPAQIHRLVHNDVAALAHLRLNNVLVGDVCGRAIMACRVRLVCSALTRDDTF